MRGRAPLLRAEARARGDAARKPSCPASCPRGSAAISATTRACAPRARPPHTQDGYLKTFGATRLPAVHPGLEGQPPAVRATAAAMCHLLPPEKALAVARRFRSLRGLLAAYAAQPTWVLRAAGWLRLLLLLHKCCAARRPLPCCCRRLRRLRAKQEMLVGLALDPGKGRAIGKKASKDVYAYFASTDPSTPAREEAAGPGQDDS